MRTSTDFSVKSESKFENYMNNASSEKTNNVSSKTENRKTKTNSKNDRSFSDKTVKKADSKGTEKADSKEEIAAQNSDDTLETPDTNVSEVSENMEKETTAVSEKENELKEEIAEVLGVSVDEVENALEQLGMSVFDLKDPEKLLGFLQEVFDAEAPSDLLNIEGIKDIIVQVKQAVEKKTSDFDSVLQDFEAPTELEENVFEPEKNVVSEKKDEIAVVEKDESLSAEKTVKQGVKNETPIHAKNREETEEVKAKNVEETPEIKIDGSLAAKQDSGFGQQNAFHNNNNNAVFENNSYNNNNSGISNVAFENINKAFNQIAAKTQSLRNVNTTDVINQIIDKFKAGIVKENVSQIKINLKPEYLGDVSLKIVSENGIVSAQFTAENQKIKEIIEANFNELKNMLDEQGVQVSELSVSVGNENSENERNAFLFEHSKSSKRINNIINDSSDDDEENAQGTVEYVDEGDVLQTSVNYTA